MDIHPSKLLAQCPLCQSSYGNEAIRLVGEREGTRLFHCQCRKCGHAMLAVVLETGGWVSSIGVMTDLEEADARLFQSATAISSDECVKMHEGLENNSREICQLLLKV